MEHIGQCDGDAYQAVTGSEGSIPDAGDRISLNRVRNDSLASSSSITIGDGDFSVSRGVCQVIQTGSLEGQECTDKDRKKRIARRA